MRCFLFGSVVLAAALMCCVVKGADAKTPAPENLSPSRTAENRWSRVLVRTPGPGYRAEKIVKWSYYNLPIDQSVELCGRSRKWGDASLDVQARCIEAIVHELRSQNFSDDDIAFAVSLCRVESGFNPDAAAGITSAAGLVQMIKRTRLTLCERLQIAPDNPFDVQMQARCLAELLRENLRNAEKLVGTADAEQYYAVAYGFHHDGHAPSDEIVDLAVRKVIPYMHAARLALKQQ